MTMRMGLLAAGIFACIAHLPAAAEDAAGARMPDLKGVWTGPYQVNRSNGRAEGILTLKVTEQDGPLLRLEKSWETAPGGAPGDVGGALVTKAIEELVGVIGFDGRGVQFAEQGDGGVYSGSLTSPDTLELLYIESGHQATAYRVVMTRTK
jgi:hypothetical protein